MRIPAFACIDEEDAVAGVFDDAAVIAEVQSELGSFIGSGGENDEEVVGAFAEAILEIHAFVLEKGEWFAVWSSDAFDGERAGELKARRVRRRFRRACANRFWRRAKCRRERKC